MVSFSGLGIGLSFVFGLVLMGLVAELYYRLWWKKKIASSSNGEIDGCFSGHFCWKKNNSVMSRNSSEELTTTPLQVINGGHEQEDLESKGYGEDGVENEIMRLHNLCGPPRFLFTIKEESKEDLESRGDRSSRKGSRTVSLSDFLVSNATPVFTPLSSPTIKGLDSYKNHGFNPLFESLTEEELNQLRSSPPPKFKFLKDAEDKLLRRLLMEQVEKKRDSTNAGKDCQDEKDASFAKLFDKSIGRDQLHNQASQVLPLASSPPLLKA